MAGFFQTMLLLSIFSSLNTHKCREDFQKSLRESNLEKRVMIIRKEITKKTTAQMKGDIGKHDFRRMRREAKSTELKEQIRTVFNRTALEEQNGTGLIKKKRKYKKRNTTHLIGKLKRIKKKMTKEELHGMNEKIRAYWRKRMAQGITRRFPNRNRTWSSEQKKQKVVEKIRKTWMRRKESVGTKIFKEHGERMRKIWKRLREEEGRTDLFRIQTKNLRTYWNNLREQGRTDIMNKIHKKQSKWMTNFWQTDAGDKRLRDMSIRMKIFWRRRRKEIMLEERELRRRQLIVSCMENFDRTMKAKGLRSPYELKQLNDLFKRMLDEYIGLERREEHAIFMKGMWGDKLEEWDMNGYPGGDISNRLSLFWTPDKRTEMSEQLMEYWRREKEYCANNKDGGE
uniref:Uncharacterized protein n=1 Tax=Cacopsylla melanoneura TaxID=428564 RepID=A0A8D8YZI1_9HEMI